MGIFDAIGSALGGSDLLGIGSIASGIGGLLSGFNQSNAQSQTQKDLQALQQMLQQGFTDAEGNKVSYVPGKGWTTTLSDPQRAADAKANKNIASNESRKTMEEIARTESLTPDDIYALLSSATRNANDRATTNAANTAVRTAGIGANAGNITGALTRDARLNQTQSDAQAKAQSLLNSNQINQDRLTPLMEKYGFMAAPYEADQANLAGMANNFAGLASSAGSAAANANAGNPWLSTIGQAGQAIGDYTTFLWRADQNKKAQNSFANAWRGY